MDRGHTNWTTLLFSFAETAIKFVIGCALLAAGVRTVVVPIYDYMVTQRLEMTPWMPPYKMWLKPSPVIRLNLYIFTAQNADAFLNGTDAKLRLKEIGPIVYREHLEHADVVFHPNSTLSYTAVRRLEFLEDENEPGILNRTIFVPNFVILVRYSLAYWGDAMVNRFRLYFRPQPHHWTMPISSRKLHSNTFYTIRWTHCLWTSPSINIYGNTRAIWFKRSNNWHRS